MNAKLIAAFVVAAATVAAPVFAAESADYGNIAAAGKPVSRADVRAEVLRARAAGELDITEANFPYAAPASVSMLTIMEVRDEARRARAAGELDITEANFPVLAAAPAGPAATLTRAEVRAEVIRANAAGELTFTDAGVVLAKR